MGRLKKIEAVADITGTMTASTITIIDQWATKPFGQAALIALAALGVMSSIVVDLVATVYTEAAWSLVLLGATLAATSVRLRRGQASSVSSALLR